MIKLNPQRPITPASALATTSTAPAQSVGAHEQPQFLRVSRINFLIHPLFAPAMLGYFDTKYAELQALYADAAHQMGPNEILCVFLPYEPRDLNEMPHSCSNLFMYLLTSLQTALGKRLCAFNSTLPIQSPPRKLRQALLPRFEKKGFLLPDNVASTAFGESFKVCVLQGAANFRTALGLKKPTSLMPYYSDEHHTTSFEGDLIFGNENVLSRGGFKLVMGSKL